MKIRMESSLLQKSETMYTARINETHDTYNINYSVMLTRVSKDLDWWYCSVMEHCISPTSRVCMQNHQKSIRVYSRV